MRRLARLRSLDLQSNRLTSVQHLASCTALEELCLSGNGLTDVQVLHTLNSVTDPACA